MKKSARRSVAALLAAPLLVVSAGAAATARTDPDEGSRFTDRRTHTGPDGATFVETTSCTDSAGNVYSERRTRRAGADGEDTRIRRSGDPAACADASNGAERAGKDRNVPSPVTVNAPINTGDITVLGGGTPIR